MKLPGIKTIAGWVLGAAALAAGGFILSAFWYWFSEFPRNLGAGTPPGQWRFYITFWYYFPGFQAGVLAGLAPYATPRGLGRLLRDLNIAVWAENVVNFAIMSQLFSTGALF